MHDKEKQVEDRAREIRNAYYREWRRRNPEKVKAAKHRYWIRKAEAELADPDEQGEG